MHSSKQDLLKQYHSAANSELVAAFEQMQDKLSSYTDILTSPRQMFNSEVFDAVKEQVLESAVTALEGIDYGKEKGFYTNDNDETVTLEMADLHKRNMDVLLEASASAYRAATPFNLNALTPLDGFIPFTIVRSYMPMIAKDIIPFEATPNEFIRIRKDRRYLTVKGKKYLRPDVYFDPDNAAEIINSSRGALVTQDWYPAALTEGDETTPPTYDTFSIKEFDLLGKSGGVRNTGDELDIDVCVAAVKMVDPQDGTEYIVEDVNAYPDITSISPQRSVSATLRIPVKDNSGAVVRYLEDKLFGEYNGATNEFNLVCQNGIIKQVKFGGHMSNKNNTEYFSYTNDAEVESLPIPEGIHSNVPITPRDLQLFKEVGNVDIIAVSVNEMTEAFTELEDISVLNTLGTQLNKWRGVKETPFKDFTGPVVFSKTVDLTFKTDGLKKRNELIQDELAYAIGRVVSKVRDACKAEQFKVKLFCHPNIASLLVGDNVDWKITEGTAMGTGVRADYRLGIVSCAGDEFPLVSSMKIKEAAGIRFVVLPVNEKNFLSWKHYKSSTIFDNNHRTDEHRNNPNILGIAKFLTHGFVPLQGEILLENYDD